MDANEINKIIHQEEVLAWLDRMDRQGLSMPLREMNKLLDEAPEAAKHSEEYHYLRGLCDGRFLNEELGAGGDLAA